MNQEKVSLLKKITLLFLEYGYQKLTMAQMAKKLGVSTKKLYSLFHDKETLIKEAMAMRTDLFIAMGEEMRSNSENAVHNYILFRKKVHEIVPEHQQKRNIEQLKLIDKKLYRSAVKDLRIINSVCFEMIHRRGVAEGLFDNKFSSEMVSELYADLFIISRGMKYKSIEEFKEKVNLATKLFFRSLLTNEGFIIFNNYEDSFDIE